MSASVGAPLMHMGAPMAGPSGGHPVTMAAAKVVKEKGTGRFRIDGFSLLPQKQGESIDSGPLIELGGATWDILIWPAGRRDSSDGYMSAGVRCSAMSSKTPLTAAFTLSVLSKAGGDTGDDLAARSLPIRTFTDGMCCFFMDYMSKDVLLDPSRGFCHNDAVVFEASLTVVNDPVFTSAEPVVEGLPPAPETELAADLGALWKSGNRSDVVLQVGQEELRAHGQILAARSSVFDRMLSGPMSEATTGIVRIADISSKVLRLLCEFVYMDTIHDESVLLEEGLLSELMQAAAKYDVPGLVRLCVAKASSRIQVDNAAEWLMLASQLRVEPLRRHCLNIVVANLSEVQATEGWQRLIQDKQLFMELGPELFQEVASAMAGEIAPRRRS